MEEYLIDHEEQPYEVFILSCFPFVTSLVRSNSKITKYGFISILLSSQALFLKAVKLYNSGDFSSSARDMELAAAEYFKTYNMCLLSCEGSCDVQEFKDFYPTLAGQ